MRGAKIPGVLDLEDYHLKCPLRLVNCVIEEEMILDRGKYSLLDFTGSQTGPIYADSIQVQHDLMLKDEFNAIGEVRLHAVDIGGDLDCSGGKFENPGGYVLYGDPLTTQGGVYLSEKFNADCGFTSRKCLGA